MIAATAATPPTAAPMAATGELDDEAAALVLCDAGVVDVEPLIVDVIVSVADVVVLVVDVVEVVDVVVDGVVLVTA